MLFSLMVAVSMMVGNDVSAIMIAVAAVMFVAGIIGFGFCVRMAGNEVNNHNVSMLWLVAAAFAACFSLAFYAIAFILAVVVMIASLAWSSIQTLYDLGTKIADRM